MECIRDNYFFQHVTEDTRQRGDDKPSLLDLLFTNEPDMISKLEILNPLGKSDHSIIKFTIPCNIESSPPKITVKYEKGDYAGFSEELKKIDWPGEFSKFPNDVDKQWVYFRNTYQRLEKDTSF